MQKLSLTLILGAIALLSIGSEEAEAGGRKTANRWGYRHAQTIPWHGNYYHHAYGQPLALVVPPNVNTERRMGWGVSQSEVVPIYHQFRRGYTSSAMGGNGFRPTPRWPSHTDQFGVYYVRGPW